MSKEYFFNSVWGNVYGQNGFHAFVICNLLSLLQVDWCLVAAIQPYMKQKWERRTGTKF